MSDHERASHSPVFVVDGAGDFKFAETFRDVLSDPRIPGAAFSYNAKPSYNPDHNITSWFQVFRSRPF